MVKVAAHAEARTHVMKLAEVFRARVIDVGARVADSRVHGHERTINRAPRMRVLRPFGLLEVARSGHVAMVRGIQSQAGEAEAEAEVATDNVGRTRYRRFKKGHEV